jgi:hypothetical protein
MIANSRRSASKRLVVRQYEFSRFQGETFACAYEALIPAVARCLERARSARRGAEVTAMVDRLRRTSATGA